MKNRSHAITLWWTAAALACTAAAAVADGDGASRPRLAFSGEMSYRLLQLVNTGGLYARDTTWLDERQFDRMWQHRVVGEARVRFVAARRLSFTVGYRAGLVTGTGLSECDARLGIGGGESPPCELTGGIFRFTYNPDARNLGEYLILSGCYPGYVFSGRDWATHTGLHLRSTIVPNLVQDLLITSEMDQIPFYDFSLAYIGTVTLGRSLVVGGGVSFYRHVPVRPDLTTPPPETVNGETHTYTHRGIKLMGRVSWDPKRLFGKSGVLGDEDLKVYAEAALLGVEDYPEYYDRKKERVPVMAGVNLPAFGFLDYCAVEGEWYGSPHNNIAPTEQYRAVPIEEGFGDADDIKWSVSFRRTLKGGIRFDARAANDHLRFEDASGGVEPWERTVARDHWYWSLAVTAAFRTY